MNKFATISVSLLCALPLAATAQQTQQQTQQRTATTSGYGPVAGDQELSLSANGTMSGDFDGLNLNANIDWGWYLGDQFLVGVRQGVNYINIEGADLSDDFWNGATSGYAQWVFNLGAWRPFVGASLGYIYGDGIEDSFFAGAEGGSKFYVQERTFINARAEYRFAFNDADAVDDVQDAFANSDVALSLGVGYNF